MLAILRLAWGFFGGAVGQYVLIGGLALGGLAWLRYDAAAPYRAAVVKLHKDAAKNEAIAEADTIRADVAEAALASAQAQLESLIHDQKPDACRLSADDVKRLRVLAAGGR